MTTAATLTAPKTLTARQIAFRNARREQDANRRSSVILRTAITGALNAVSEDEQFVVDSAGRKVRQSKATNAEIASFLRGNRVVDTIDILEQVGETAFNNLVANGSLVRDAKFNRFSKCNLYWITTKARDIYGLPARIRLSTDFDADYVEA